MKVLPSMARVGIELFTFGDFWCGTIEWRLVVVIIGVENESSTTRNNRVRNFKQHEPASFLVLIPPAANGHVKKTICCLEVSIPVSGVAFLPMNMTTLEQNFGMDSIMPFQNL